MRWCPVFGQANNPSVNYGVGKLLIFTRGCGSPKTGHIDK
jgi:hypothetical protein